MIRVHLCAQIYTKMCYVPFYKRSTTAMFTADSGSVDETIDENTQYVRLLGTEYKSSFKRGDRCHRFNHVSKLNKQEVIKHGRMTGTSDYRN